MLGGNSRSRFPTNCRIRTPSSGYSDESTWQQASIIPSVSGREWEQDEKGHTTLWSQRLFMQSSLTRKGALHAAAQVEAPSGSLLCAAASIPGSFSRGPDFKKRISFQCFILQPSPTLSEGDRGRNGRCSAAYFWMSQGHFAERGKSRFLSKATTKARCTLTFGLQREHIFIYWSLVVNIGKTFLK